jgi:hypothetical protein
MAAYPGLTSTNGFVIFGGAGNDISTSTRRIFGTSTWKGHLVNCIMTLLVNAT